MVPCDGVCWYGPTTGLQGFCFFGDTTDTYMIAPDGRLVLNQRVGTLPAGVQQMLRAEAPNVEPYLTNISKTWGTGGSMVFSRIQNPTKRAAKGVVTNPFDDDRDYFQPFMDALVKTKPKPLSPPGVIHEDAHVVLLRQHLATLVGLPDALRVGDLRSPHVWERDHDTHLAPMYSSLSPSSCV